MPLKLHIFARDKSIKKPSVNIGRKEINENALSDTFQPKIIIGSVILGFDDLSKDEINNLLKISKEAKDIEKEIVQLYLDIQKLTQDKEYLKNLKTNYTTKRQGSYAEALAEFAAMQEERARLREQKTILQLHILSQETNTQLNRYQIQKTSQENKPSCNPSLPPSLEDTTADKKQINLKPLNKQIHHYTQEELDDIVAFFRGEKEVVWINNKKLEVENPVTKDTQIPQNTEESTQEVSDKKIENIFKKHNPEPKSKFSEFLTNILVWFQEIIYKFKKLLLNSKEFFN